MENIQGGVVIQKRYLVNARVTRFSAAMVVSTQWLKFVSGSCSLRSILVLLHPLSSWE